MSGQSSERILCFYANGTTQIQIARLTNLPNFKFERVVFPGQRLLFEAVPTAQLEVQRLISSSEIISDRISCNCLRVSGVAIANGQQRTLSG